MGYGGYNSQGKKGYPEFYEKLKDIKVSIVPKKSNGNFSKKIQLFNNSVGYASNEEGGNLIVKEQWLEDVEWDIFIKIEDTDIHQELKERMKNYNFEYTVYLGKNDHLATIGNIEIFQGENFVENESEINSLFLRKSIEGFSEEDFEFITSEEDEIKHDYKYEEKLPISLHEISNQYEVEKIIFTNKKCILKNKKNFLKVNNQIIEFY